MEVKVSLIVPVYNAETYLKECLESLVHQTLKEIEIILIDDASTDSTPYILKRYKEDYPDKVRLITQGKNCKQGAARNQGLKRAVGQYVTFVDSDDVLDTNAILLLYEKGEKEDCDIVFCDYMIFGHSIEQQCGQHVYAPYLGKMTIEKKKALLTTSVVPWAKLIRRRLIIENEIWFPEQSFYEDQATTYLFYLYTNKTTKISAPLYWYRVSEYSTTSLTDAGRHFQHMDMALLLIERMKRRGFAEIYKEELEFFLFQQMYILGILNCVKQFTILPEKYIDKLLKNFIVNCPHYKQNTYYCNYVSEREKKILETHLQSRSRMIKGLRETGFNNYCPNYMMVLKNNIEKLQELFGYIQERGLVVALWGAGKYVVKLIQCLEKMEFRVDYIIDQNIEREGDVYESYKISYIDVISNVSLILIPYTQWSYSIKNKLKEMHAQVYTLDLEIYIKHNLGIGIGEYMEKMDI